AAAAPGVGHLRHVGVRGGDRYHWRPGRGRERGHVPPQAGVPVLRAVLYVVAAGERHLRRRVGHGGAPGAGGVRPPGPAAPVGIAARAIGAAVDGRHGPGPATRVHLRDPQPRRRAPERQPQWDALPPGSFRMTTKAPALIDWLVNACTTSASLGAAVAPNTVAVYDGPPTPALDAPLKLLLRLPHPPSDSIHPPVTVPHTQDDLGRATRPGRTGGHCCAGAWSGREDISAVRHSVAAIVAAVEVIVRSDQTQFGGNASFAYPGVTSAALLQNNTTTGAIARIPF